MDESEREQTSADDLPAVLKTAVLTSTGGRARPLQIKNRSSQSTEVRGRPPLSAKLAVGLAVIYEGRAVVKARRVVKEGGGRPGATPIR